MSLQCLLHAACCLLYAAGYILPDVWCLLPVLRYALTLLPAPCLLHLASCSLLPAAHWLFTASGFLLPVLLPTECSLVPVLYACCLWTDTVLCIQVVQSSIAVLGIPDILVLIRILLFSSVALKMATKKISF
jgi:hypothetical protein